MTDHRDVRADPDTARAALEELGFDVRRIKLVKVKDEIRDDDGERDQS